VTDEVVVDLAAAVICMASRPNARSRTGADSSSSANTSASTREAPAVAARPSTVSTEFMSRASKPSRSMVTAMQSSELMQ